MKTIKYEKKANQLHKDLLLDKRYRPKVVRTKKAKVNVLNEKDFAVELKEFLKNDSE